MKTTSISKEIQFGKHCSNICTFLTWHLALGWLSVTDMLYPECKWTTLIHLLGTKMETEFLKNLPVSPSYTCEMRNPNPQKQKEISVPSAPTALPVPKQVFVTVTKAGSSIF